MPPPSSPGSRGHGDGDGNGSGDDRHGGAAFSAPVQLPTLPVLYQDKHIAVVHKPAGFCVHPPGKCVQPEPATRPPLNVYGCLQAGR